MIVEQYATGFVIMRGSIRNTQYFNFYVDHDSASWSKRQRCIFKTREAAEEAKNILAARALLRRRERVKADLN